MDYNKQKLEAVELEIKDLIKRRTELKKLKRNRQLLEDDEEELTDIPDTMAQLQGFLKYWQDIVKISTKKEAKLEEENVAFGEASDEFIKSVTGIKYPVKDLALLPLDDTVVPSADFLAQFEKNCNVWIMNSEASRRTFIDLFLRDVVAREEFCRKLKIYCELTMSSSCEQGSKKLKLSGRSDYTIGHARETAGNFVTLPTDIHLLTCEAKEAWKEEDLLQCIAEMATLFKSRKDAGKQNCKVWGIWTNAYLWQFLFIDNDGQVYSSEPLTLSTGKQSSIEKIYRCVHYCVKQAYDASPTTTPISSRALTPDDND